MRWGMKARALSVPLLAAFVAVATAWAGEQKTTAESPAVIDISPNAPPDLALKPVQNYPFMQIMAGDKPVYGSREDFVSKDGELRVDYSQYSTISLKLLDWPADEFMYFVEGQVEITDAQGRGKVYGPGDMILMPKGFSGTWRQLSPIRKISVTYGWSE